MEFKLSRPLVIFDLEATGLNIAKDRIIEFSFVKCMPDGKEITWSQRLNPEIPICEEAEKVHGISIEQLKDEPTFADVAKKIVTFIENGDLAGYNSNKFDIPMLMEEFARVDVTFELDKRHCVDVQNIFHKMESRTLAAAYKFYCGKSLIDAHQAEADTVATMEVLKSQLSRYEDVAYVDKEGKSSRPVVNNIEALAAFSKNRNIADLAGNIGYNNKGQEIFNFGKHKGKVVEEVFQRESQYYDWMMKSDFSSYTKRVITTIKLRAFNK